MGMKPEVIALDVIETLFSLEALERSLRTLGLPEGAGDAFLLSVLRDAFALEASGVFKAFPEVARGALAAALSSKGMEAGADTVKRGLSAFGELDPHPDVAAGLERARHNGFRLLALTNGSAEATLRLFARAGLDLYLERIVSIEELRHWKPSPEVYRHAAAVMGVAPQRVALVAAHDWDIHGAREAGLSTGWLRRAGKPRNEAFAPPTVEGASLAEVVDALASL